MRWYLKIILTIMHVEVKKNANKCYWGIGYSNKIRNFAIKSCVLVTKTKVKIYICKTESLLIESSSIFFRILVSKNPKVKSHSMSGSLNQVRIVACHLCTPLKMSGSENRNE